MFKKHLINNMPYSDMLQLPGNKKKSRKKKV